MDDDFIKIWYCGKRVPLPDPVAIPVLLWSLWYTFDDWLARATGKDWLGDVPLVLSLIVAVLIAVILARVSHPSAE